MLHKPLHNEEEIKSFSVGANMDDNEELVGLQQGKYLDARNMRPVDDAGDSGALKKIGGEVIEFPDIENRCIPDGVVNISGLPIRARSSGNSQIFQVGQYYECVLLETINTDIVEIWVNNQEAPAYTGLKAGDIPPIVRVNGKIVLSSPLLPVVLNYPLQWAVDNTCLGGELYFTDNYHKPMFLNIQDLKRNSGMEEFEDGTTYCTQKYFDDFQLSTVILQLQKPIDKPIFVDMIDVGVGGGLEAGQYIYSIRYTTVDGDKTVRSVGTNPIAVPYLQSSSSTVYPYVMTHGGVPTQVTQYAPHIRFRVTNLFDYDYIEILRSDYTDNLSIGTVPNSYSIKKIQIQPQQVGIIDFIDSLANEDDIIQVTDEDLNSVYASIERAKAIRYFNQRLHLMNVKYESASIDDSVTFGSHPATGNTIFPIMEKMTWHDKAGHHDPYNHTNFRSYAHGERYGFGLVGFDTNGGATFAVKIDANTAAGFQNIQMPDRRDSCDASNLDSKEYSQTSALYALGKWRGMVKAGNNIGNTSDNTFEIFDLTNPVAKSGGITTFTSENDTVSECINILSDGQKTVYNNEVGESDGHVINTSQVNYKPLTPVSQSDANVVGHNYIVNTNVYTHTVGNTNKYVYRPAGFSPNWYSLGVMIYSVENIPESVQSFSIVRTAPAGRVVAEGLAVYKLSPDTTSSSGSGTNTTKSLSDVCFYSPDIANGFAIDSLQGLYLQTTAPLGFFSEVYSYYSKSLNATAAAIDIISYARVIENGTAPYELNPHDSIGTFGYTLFGGWRNSPSSWAAWQPFENFENESSSYFNITQSVVDTEANQDGVYTLSLSNSIYLENGFGGSVGADFADSDVRAWHEPFYTCNIVQDGKQIQDSNTSQYQDTGYYQKVKSLIGVSDANNNNSSGYLLVDERWDDCVPNRYDQYVIAGLSTYSKGHTYIYVDEGDGVLKAWLNVAYLDGTYVAGLQAQLLSGSALDANNVTIYGMYTFTSTADEREYTIQFSVSSGTIPYIPILGSFIYVKYDSRFPIRVFGGTNIVGDAIFPVINKKSENGEHGDPKNGTFDWDAPFPYFGYDLNSRIFIARSATGGSKIQDYEKCRLSPTTIDDKCSVRQLIVSYPSTSKVNLAFAYNISGVSGAPSTEQFFPLINYIYKPYGWNDSSMSNPVFQVTNNMFTQYFVDYVDEQLLFGYGGFRTNAAINIDYSHTSNIRSYRSKPVVGFKEKTEFCTRDIYSLARNINVQDSPNVRTFPALNYYDISDDTGEIKRAYDSLADKYGNNLYAFTEKGVCMLIADKKILSDISGAELAIIGTGDNQVVLGQYWLTKSSGMDSEFWRSAAEYENHIWWVNKQGAYTMFNNDVREVAEGSYHSILHGRLLAYISGDSNTNNSGLYDKICSTYDMEHDEYWVRIKADPDSGAPISDDLFVYNDRPKNPEQAGFTGRYDYRFDKMMSSNNESYGARYFKTYHLHDGTEINGAPITAYLLDVVSKGGLDTKEYIRLRVNSDNSPTSIEIYNKKTDTFSGLNQSVITQFRNYGGFENYVPRNTLTDGNRMQGRSMVYKVIHNLEEPFKIVTTQVTSKKIN